jgi:hypothetical protein
MIVRVSMLAQEKNMPSVLAPVVINNNTLTAWNPSHPADVRLATPGNPLTVHCVTEPANQPPAGFLNAAHFYSITGNNMPTGTPFQAINVSPYAPTTEPPLIFSFR